MRDITLSNFVLSADGAPFVIAELSGNHKGSLDRALAIVEAAAEAGAHGFKLQTYTAQSMTLDSDVEDFIVTGTGEAWESRRLFDLYSEAATPYEWHSTIYRRCYELGMIPFSTPFDDDAVDFLAELKTEIYKVASFELTHIPLLRKIASIGKPVILSTGMATDREVQTAVNTLKEHGCRDVVLLQCTSAYPAQFSDANLRTVSYLRAKYDCLSGLSDHTPGITAPIVATALGASVIEKHLTLDRYDGAVDSHFSLEPHEFATLVQSVNDAHQALGHIKEREVQSEVACKAYRRSIYISKQVKQGDKITADNIKIVRPGKGLEPIHYDVVLGRTFELDLPPGTALQWEHLTGELSD